MLPLTAAYFEEVDRHVIGPLRSGSISEHCFAAALLMFGAMDGTGFLLHDKAAPGNRERLKTFLRVMLPVYIANESLIWNLRNDLVHSAMNVAAYMSKTDCAPHEHLQPYVGGTLVHTGILFEDFCHAIETIRIQLDPRTAFADQVEGKLTAISIMDPMDRQVRGELTTPRPEVGLLIVRPPRRRKVTVEWDNGSWRAEIPDVPRCAAAGQTPLEALEQLSQSHPDEVSKLKVEDFDAV